MKPVILIPTYNESVAIVELLHQLSTLHNVRDFDVVVLDDNSPDKTADIVESMNFPWVSVLRRPGKAGRRCLSRRICPCITYEKVFTNCHDGCRWIS